MAFNIVARNQDDHVKNIAFLMDRPGRWSLSPAFDVTYSYNPAGRWTGAHQMTLNGKGDDFEVEDFVACARNAALKRGRATAILARSASRFTLARVRGRSGSDWRNDAQDRRRPSYGSASVRCGSSRAAPWRSDPERRFRIRGNAARSRRLPRCAGTACASAIGM